MKHSASNSNNLPLVSVCIPTFNGEKYLQEALDSVTQQSYANLEVIISDDASTDKTLEIISDYNNTSEIPVYVFHHIQSGIAENWNNSLKHAHGIYIKFLFQDDVLKPECISQMVDVMESDNKIALVTSKRDVITELNNRFTEGWIKNFDDLQINLNLPNAEVTVLSGRDLLKSSNFKKKPINIIGEPVSVLFRKDLIGSIGYFDTDMFQLVDYEFWLRMFKNYDIAFLQEHLVQFRLHETQASFLNNKYNINDKDIYYKLLYNRFFWLLHFNFKWYLLKKYHFVFKFYRFIKSFIKIKHS